MQDEIRDLKAKIRKLKQIVQERDEKILELGAPEQQQQHLQRSRVSKREQEKVEDMFTETVLWKFVLKYGGISRYSILNDEWHKANKNAATDLFGFRNWQEAKTIAQQTLKIQPTTPNIYKVFDKKKTAGGGGTGQQRQRQLGQEAVTDLELRECSDWEQAFAVKLMDRTGLTCGRVAIIFHKSRRNVTRWKQLWIPKWGINATDTGAAAATLTLQQQQHTEMSDEVDLDGDFENRKMVSGTLQPFKSRQMIGLGQPGRRKRKKQTEQAEEAATTSNKK